MRKYSKEYWLAHYEFVMGHKSKLAIDTSDANWTKKNIEKVLNNKIPYGMTGTNGAIALMEYLENYHPEKDLQQVAKLMLGYIESIRSESKPLIKIHTYYRNIMNT